jgi:predicted ATPase
MRIAISGTACQGKSTLIKDFTEKWPNYTTLDKTYRDIITEQGLQHSSSTNKDTQWAILNFMIDELQKTSKGDKIIFDRCPLDNIVYSIWSEAKKDSDIDEEFIKKCMPLVRESLRFIDIIFFTPITKVAPVEIVDDELRETKKEYIEEIDNIFKAVHRDYVNNQKSTFFVEDDRPAIIEVFGNREERIELIKLYLDNDGDFIEPGNIITPEEIEEMEKMKKAFRIE